MVFTMLKNVPKKLGFYQAFFGNMLLLFLCSRNTAPYLQWASRRPAAGPRPPRRWWWRRATASATSPPPRSSCGSATRSPLLLSYWLIIMTDRDSYISFLVFVSYIFIVCNLIQETLLYFGFLNIKVRLILDPGKI